MPYVVPMNYGVTKDEADGHYIIYLHGANEGRKLEVVKANPKCCITLERNVQAFEGRIACQYGTAYRVDVWELSAKQRLMPGNM